jgi:hypothetical protein
MLLSVARFLRLHTLRCGTAYGDGTGHDPVDSPHDLVVENYVSGPECLVDGGAGCGLRVPTIATSTAGLCKVHAMASCGSEIPSSCSARCRRRSTARRSCSNETPLNTGLFDHSHRRLQRLDRQSSAERLHLADVEVRHPDVEDLPVGDQLAELIRRLHEQRLRVGPVHLVQGSPQAVVEPWSPEC